MKFELVGGKFVLQRSGGEKAPLIQRLSRIEGQVRGLRQMIEENRYSGDITQQSSAVIAAVREVTLLLISQQLQAHAEAVHEETEGHPTPGPGGMQDFIDMLRTAYRFQ